MMMVKSVLHVISRNFRHSESTLSGDSGQKGPEKGQAEKQPGPVQYLPVEKTKPHPKPHFSACKKTS